MPISEEAIIEIVKTVIPAVCGSGIFIAMVAIGVSVFLRRRKLPKEAMEAIIDLNERINYLERRLETREDQVRQLRDENRYPSNSVDDES